METVEIPQNSQINQDDSAEKTPLSPLRLLLLLGAAIFIGEGFVM